MAPKTLEHRASQALLCEMCLRVNELNTAERTGAVRDAILGPIRLHHGTVSPSIVSPRMSRYVALIAAKPTVRAVDFFPTPHDWGEASEIGRWSTIASIV